MQQSQKIGTLSSPVLAQISELLKRGEAKGSVRPGLDPLTLCFMRVAHAQFHISNRHTFSAIFSVDIGAAEWMERYDTETREMLRSYLAAPGRRPDG
ncbi:hypothetical protein [Acidimangrovimonas sediminis]|uniref:hypothetical protein n=1 Tax=Acidimangrovimonas sediminis TaxID=2056283 RepID=UPI000C805F02|nr:hypothetical protein [Acidimangrovimonas sediminis]